MCTLNRGFCMFGSLNLSVFGVGSRAVHFQTGTALGDTPGASHSSGVSAFLFSSGMALNFDLLHARLKRPASRSSTATSILNTNGSAFAADMINSYWYNTSCCTSSGDVNTGIRTSVRFNRDSASDGVGVPGRIFHSYRYAEGPSGAPVGASMQPLSGIVLPPSSTRLILLFRQLSISGFSRTVTETSAVAATALPSSIVTV